MDSSQMQKPQRAGVGILFIAMSRLSTDGAEFFGLPQDRTLIDGSRIEV
jgi:hypothetical protein